jgi:hypothetical protein
MCKSRVAVSFEGFEWRKLFPAVNNSKKMESKKCFMASSHFSTHFVIFLLMPGGISDGEHRENLSLLLMYIPEKHNSKLHALRGEKNG